MGIVNCTPDSFSDGGQHPDAAAAVAHGQRMATEGATWLDVGGESTRPGAAEVPVDDELARVLPVVRELAAAGHAVSIDTRKASVAEAALEAGAMMVNDVSAGRHDPAILEVTASAGALYTAMHSRATPADMQRAPRYDDVVAEVREELADALARAAAAGIAPDRLVLDPGFGFAKDDGHNLTLLARLDELHDLGAPLLVGLSRKRTLGHVTGRVDPGERLAASVAAVALAVAHGAALVRVHDVAPSLDALRLATEVRRMAVRCQDNNRHGGPVAPA